jgi:SAM-dependent methyltransferase
MNAANHPWELIFRREGRVFTEPFRGFKAAAKKFKQNGCRRILDLGCGNGRHVVALAKAGFSPIGFDISSSGLGLTRAWLAEECLQASLVAADMRQGFPFATGSFDGILSTQVIHHALLSESRVTIAEIWRILAKGGIAFVTVAGWKQDGERYQEIEPGTYVPLDGTEKGLPHHFFTEEELHSEFGRFQIHEIRRRAKGGVLALWLGKVA